MEKVMLSFDKVSAHYGKIQALHEVSLHINQGEIVTLIGANGAGKTTLLGTLCGDPRATSGRIVFDDKDITDWQTAKIMREAVAIVPEGRRVFSRMTVEENLAMGGFFAERDQFQERIKWVYELFPRLHERRVQRAGTMSGGEQQMLAIGRALMSNPRLLLLDEPSLGLAPIIIQQIFDTIEQLREQGSYTVSDALKAKIQEVFAGGFCNDIQTREKIGHAWRDHRYLIDTHTAVAYHVLDDYRRETGDTTPSVVVSTASPFKFCDQVLRGIGGTADAFGPALIRRLSCETQIDAPAPLTGLDARPVRFGGCVDKAQMLHTVDEFLK